MKISVGLLTRTAIAGTAAALLVAATLWPDTVDRLINTAQGEAKPAEADGGNGDQTSIVHGAISGVAESPASLQAQMPGAWSPSSRFDREFQDLLIGPRGHEGLSIWDRIAEFLPRSGPALDGVRKKSIWDPEYGDISLSLDLRETGERRSAGEGSESAGTERFVESVRALQASEPALIEISNQGSTSAGSEDKLVPIFVDAGTSFSTTIATAPGANKVELRPPGWYGTIPAPSSVNHTVWWQGSSKGAAPLVNTALSPAVLSASRTFAPSPVTKGRKTVGSTSVSTSASLVVTAPVVTAPQVPSNNIVSTSSSANLLTASSALHTELASQALVQSLAPSSDPSIFVADIAHDLVKKYDAITGAVVSGFSISSPSPSALSLSGAALYVADVSAGTVKEYDANSGAVVGGFTTIASSASAGNGPIDLASSSTSLYVGNNLNGTVKKYNATTGAVDNSFSLSSPAPFSLALSSDGANLYVGDGTLGTVKKFNASTGAVISSFAAITGVFAGSLAFSSDGLRLFVGDENPSPTMVKEYDASTGSLIAGFSISTPEVVSLAVLGNALYVGDAGNPNVQEYNATTGALIGGFSITGVNPAAIAIPEPSCALLLLGSGAMFFLGRRRASTH